MQLKFHFILNLLNYLNKKLGEASLREDTESLQ